MENQNIKKFNKKNNKQMPQKSFRKQSKPQKTEKAKKGGRQGKQPISGFSTLSQVAGVPLKRTYHSNIDVPVPKYVSEPYPICPYCGEKIDIIAEKVRTASEIKPKVNTAAVPTVNTANTAVSNAQPEEKRSETKYRYSCVLTKLFQNKQRSDFAWLNLVCQTPV